MDPDLVPKVGPTIDVFLVPDLIQNWVPKLAPKTGPQNWGPKMDPQKWTPQIILEHRNLSLSWVPDLGHYLGARHSEQDTRRERTPSRGGTL